MSPTRYFCALSASAIALLAGIAGWSKPAPADKPGIWIEVQTPRSGDPNIVSLAGKFLAQLDRAQQYAAYNKKMNEATSATTPAINQETKLSGEIPAPALRRRTQDNANSTRTENETTPVVEPSAAAAPRAYSMVGTIADVNCAAAPQIQF